MATAATGYRPRLRAERLTAEVDAAGLSLCRGCGIPLAFRVAEVWCSDQCAWEWRDAFEARRSARFQARSCPMCGDLIEPGRQGIYCSVRCRMRGYRVRQRAATPRA